MDFQLASFSDLDQILTIEKETNVSDVCTIKFFGIIRQGS